MISSFTGRLRSATVGASKNGEEVHLQRSSSARRLTDGSIRTSSPRSTTPAAEAGISSPQYGAASEYTQGKMDGLTSTVYLNYDLYDPPPKPAGATRFICISDTHSKTFPVPDGDVLLHSGDLSGRGLLQDIAITVDWLETLPHRLKIIIAGNHDLVLHKEWYEEHCKQEFGGRKRHLEDPEEAVAYVRSKAESKGIVYLQDELYKFRLDKGQREWSVWGSPWSPKFGTWAFGYAPHEAEDIVSRIPSCDILLTHGPPLDILDRTIFGGESAGCPILAERLPSLKPRLHVFGHIHESHGAVLKVWKPLRPSGTSSGKGPLRSSILNGTSRLKKNILGRLKGSQRDDPLEAVDGKGAFPPVVVAPESSLVTLVSTNLSSNESGDGNALWIPQLPTSVGLHSPSLSAGIRSPSSNSSDAGVIETVFVNAANAPMGPRARNSEGRQVQFGEGPFSPVIVDLID